MIIRGMNLPLIVACIVIILSLIILPLIVSYKAEKKEKNKLIPFVPAGESVDRANTK